MFISCHGISLRKYVPTLKEAAEIIHKSGYKYMELPLTTWANPEAMRKSEVKRITQDLNSIGIEVTSFGMLWPETYVMATILEIERKRNFNYSRKLFDFAVEMGVKYMNLGIGRARSPPPGVPFDKGVQLFIEFWKQAIKYAEERDVVIAIEHQDKRSDTLMNSTREAIELIKRIDSTSFQLNAQIFTMPFYDVDVPAALRAAGKMVKLVHIADIKNMEPRSIIPGRGDLDFTAIFKALKEIGYDGEICVEVSELGENPIEGLKESKTYLETKWKQA